MSAQDELAQLKSEITQLEQRLDAFSADLAVLGKALFPSRGRRPELVEIVERHGGQLAPGAVRVVN